MLRTTLAALAATSFLATAPVASAQKKAPEKKAPEKKAPEKKAPDKEKPDKEPPAPAKPTAADMEKAKQAFIKGSELFDTKDFKSAIVQFKLSYRLSRNPILFYNIGYTLDQLGNKPRALFYYRQFIKNGPAEHPNYPVAKKRAKVLARELEADNVFSNPAPKKTTTKKTPKKTATATKRKPIGEFMHKVVDEAPPRKPLDVTCFIPEEADWTVTLFFRGQRESKFTATQMKPRYRELVGRIPPSKMHGSSIQYYIEARSKDGKLAARSGRSTSPHLVLIDASAKPRYYPDLTNDRSWEGAYTGGSDTKENKGSKGSTGSGRWMDVESKKFTYLKWGATGTSLGMVGLAVAFYFSAANASSNLEAEALNSTNAQSPPCTSTNPPGQTPCIGYGDYQKDLESYGKRMQTLSRVTFTVGLLAGAAAGYLWWKEIKDKKKRREKNASKSKRSRTRLVTVPMVDRNVIGGAAFLRF
jgi:hypothetical protein